MSLASQIQSLNRRGISVVFIGELHKGTFRIKLYRNIIGSHPGLQSLEHRCNSERELETELYLAAEKWNED